MAGSATRLSELENCISLFPIVEWVSEIFPIPEPAFAFLGLVFVGLCCFPIERFIQRRKSVKTVRAKVLGIEKRWVYNGSDFAGI